MRKFPLSGLILITVSTIACSTLESETYRVGCIVEKESDRTLYEMVIVVQEVDSEHFEVSFPESVGKSNSIVEKKSVEFIRCPFFSGAGNLLNMGLRPADSR
jgi:hypothetical protein